MATVSEILQQMLGEGPEPAEKTAADSKGETSQPVTSEEDEQIAKIARELDLSPEEIEAAAAELDSLEKRAEAEKKAEEAEVLGRFMARGFVDELQKMGMQVGDPSVNKGGGKAVQQAADASCPQDGSTVLAKVKSAVEGEHVPKSPTSSEDVMGRVKKIIQTAQKVKEPNAVATPTNAN